MRKLLSNVIVFVFLISFVSAANRVKTVVDGEIILADDWNAEFDNIYADTTHTIAGTWTFNKSGTPITITPASAPSAGTLLLDINNASGTNLWSIDYEGDIVRGGSDAQTINDAATNSTTTLLTASHTSSGSAAAGLGIRNLYKLEDAAGNEDSAAALDIVWSDATSTSEDADLIVSLTKAGTLTEAGRWLSTGNLQFEGATADASETLFAITDPTADRTVTFPDATGTVVTTGNTSALVSNETNNRVLTSLGANSGANAEANLTFDGTTLTANGTGGVQFGPNSLFNGEDPTNSGHNHNLIPAPDFWFDYHHRRAFTRSIFFGEIDDPVDIGIRRATGTYPDTLDSSALGSGDTIGHFKWYPWNGTSFQGSSAAIFAETAEIPTSTDTGGNLYFSTCPINGDSLGSTTRKWVRLRHNGTLEMYTRAATEGSSTPYRVLSMTSGGVAEFGDSSRLMSLIGTTTYLRGESSATPATGTLSGQKGTGTNIAGGSLVLVGGAQTGNALPGPVYLKSAPLSDTSGTDERTPVTRFAAGLTKTTTDGASTDLFSVPLASPNFIGFRVTYAVWARSGGNTQVEFGHVDIHGVNLGGVFTMGTPTPVMDQSLSAGTLSVTFAISSANPAVLSVTVDTSLTPTSTWPRIIYSVDNLSPGDMTIL